MTYEFDLDTAVKPVEGNDPASLTQRFVGDMTDRWDIGDKPNGGYVIAFATRAIAQALPKHPHPFTVTAHYLRPAEHGETFVDIEIVRTGRKLATATASLHQGGKEKIRVIATFGDLGEANGPTVVAGAPPELPPIEDCVSRNKAAEGFSISQIGYRTDTVMHPATGWLKGEPNGTATISSWIRFADGREPDVWSLPFFADALPPAVFEVLTESVWVPTIELTVHVRAVPSPGWLRAVMTTRFLMDGYFEEDGEIWDSTGRMVAQSRQLGMLFRP
jgi:acyl-CoA thioesterase